MGRSIGLNVEVPASEQSAITSLEFFPDRNDVIAHSVKQMLQNDQPWAGTDCPEVGDPGREKSNRYQVSVVIRDAQGKRRAFEVTVDKVAQLAPPPGLWAAPDERGRGGGGRRGKRGAAFGGLRGSPLARSRRRPCPGYRYGWRVFLLSSAGLS